ncbi:MAG: hypothetical protein PHT40_03215 [Patescibacteria group bacterium]|nr:hypothetical protein [Patescibacteria group bacterium]
MSKIILVREGSWGEVKEGENDKMIKIYQEDLREAKMEVEIIDTAKEALEKVLKADASFDAVIFFSRGMEKTAEAFGIALKRKWLNRTKIIILSALIPRNKIIWIDKGAESVLPLIKDIIQNWDFDGSNESF